MCVVGPDGSVGGHAKMYLWKSESFVESSLSFQSQVIGLGSSRLCLQSRLTPTERELGLCSVVEHSLSMPKAWPQYPTIEGARARETAGC